jgi:dolichol kinase
MTTLAADSADLAADLLTLLRELDPARLRASLRRVGADEVRARASAIHDRAADLHDAAASDPAAATLLGPLGALSATPVPGSGEPDAWGAWRADVVRAYTELCVRLADWDIHVPALRPTNYARNVTHFTSAALAVVALWVLPSPAWITGIALGLAATAWTFETSRRFYPTINRALMAFFGPIAHPHEQHRVNSATWYVTALVALSVLNATRGPVGPTLGLIALGVGDPAAAIVGRAWGRVRLIHGRSLEGVLALITATLVVGAPFAWLLLPDRPPAERLWVAASAAIAGALAELFSRRIDDNLSVPVTAAFAAWWVLGAGG